jgi:hypothetical protein
VGFDGWRENVKDYLLVRNKRMIETTLHISYLIVDFAHRRHVIIEDAHMNHSIAEEMIAAGVPIVSVKQYWKMLAPHIFTSDEIVDRMFLERFGPDSED